MRARTILYTGKGGVGKTSVAAATARRCAAAGARTLVISTDPAHSLADVLQAPVAGTPTKIVKRLFAQQVQAQDELESHWGAVSDWLGGLLMERGVERIAAEELTVPPGGDELFSLLVLKAHVESGEWDVIIVDCAPTGETLRLLSFPDAARWWLDKVLGKEQSMLSAARPLARMFLDVQLPDEKVLAEVQRLVGNLVAMHELLRDGVARIDAAGDDAGPDGGLRGDADLHLPEPVRLPDRRRGREPRLPRRAGRGLLRRLARRPAGAARAGRHRLLARADPARAVLRGRGDRRRAPRRARRRAVRRATIPRASCTTGSRRSSRSTTGARSCGWTCRSRPRATSSSRRSGSS